MQMTGKRSQDKHRAMVSKPVHTSELSRVLHLGSKQYPGGPHKDVWGAGGQSLFILPSLPFKVKINKISGFRRRSLLVLGVAHIRMLSQLGSYYSWTHGSLGMFWYMKVKAIC